MNNPDHSQPTRDNQIWHAQELLRTKGLEAVYNPHAMIGRDCGCGTCFCCAALHVYKQERLRRQYETPKDKERAKFWGRVS